MDSKLLRRRKHLLQKSTLSASLVLLVSITLHLLAASLLIHSMNGVLSYVDTEKTVGNLVKTVETKTLAITFIPRVRLRSSITNDNKKYLVLGTIWTSVAKNITKIKDKKNKKNDENDKKIVFCEMQSPGCRFGSYNSYIKSNKKTKHN